VPEGAQPLGPRWHDSLVAAFRVFKRRSTMHTPFRKIQLMVVKRQICNQPQWIGMLASLPAINAGGASFH